MTSWPRPGKDALPQRGERRVHLDLPVGTALPRWPVHRGIIAKLLEPRQKQLLLLAPPKRVSGVLCCEVYNFRRMGKGGGGKVAIDK